MVVGHYLYQLVLSQGQCGNIWNRLSQLGKGMLLVPRSRSQGCSRYSIIHRTALYKNSGLRLGNSSLVLEFHWGFVKLFYYNNCYSFFTY